MTLASRRMLITRFGFVAFCKLYRDQALDFLTDSRTRVDFTAFLQGSFLFLKSFPTRGAWWGLPGAGAFQFFLPRLTYWALAQHGRCRFYFPFLLTRRPGEWTLSSDALACSVAR